MSAKPTVYCGLHVMKTHQKRNILTPIAAQSVTAIAPKNHRSHAHFGRSIGFVAGGIGDQIYHLTQLRALASASQDGRIDIACIHPGPIRKLLAGTKWVGDIIDARPFRHYRPGSGGTAIADLRSARYDTAFFMHRSTSFKLAATAAGITSRIGLRGSWLDGLLLKLSLNLNAGGDRRSLWGHRPFIAAIDEYVLTMGLSLDGDTPTISPTSSAMKEAAKLKLTDGPLIILNLFAVDEARRWPIDDALKLIAAVADDSNASFLLNAGPDAADYHSLIMQKWRLLADTNPDLKVEQLKDSLAQSPSMEKDVALYHLADYYVGVDSFTANLAMNCNLPAVILFAKTGDILRYRSRVEAIVAPIEGKIGSIETEAITSALMRLSRT